ncbi:MAG: CehA/McbA family metallohydrolase [Candidatus Poribacteria bacterium]|nr:CehA/McbA family metallohydrolase [Candidatus Poribacteria bacterium]
MSESPLSTQYYEYKGTMHLHSRYSDGSAKVPEIVGKAADAGLDFVMLTDHDSLDALYNGYEGWHDGVLLLVGQEISPRTHHYLAFDLNREIRGKYRTDYQRIVDEVRDSGGFGFIAHPYGGKKPPLFRTKGHAWTDWSITGYTGIEIWSYMIDWVENVNILTFMYHYFYPEKAIRGPRLEALRKWDEVAQQRHVVGIGSTDAHARPLPIFRFIKFFPYEYLFRTIRTHVLLDTPLSPQSLPESKQLIYDALKAGHCFIAYDFLADSMGFTFAAEMKGRGEYDAPTHLLMGDEAIFEGRADLLVSVPQPAEIRLIRNGHPIHQASGKTLRLPIDRAGVYRVELYYSDQPWIFSNPIFLRES